MPRSCPWVILFFVFAVLRVGDSVLSSPSGQTDPGVERRVDKNVMPAIQPALKLFQAVGCLRNDDLFFRHKINFATDKGCAIVPQPLGGGRG